MEKEPFQGQGKISPYPICMRNRRTETETQREKKGYIQIPENGEKEESLHNDIIM